MKQGIIATWNYLHSTFRYWRSEGVKASAKWLPPGSPQRNLSEKGIGYLSGEITDLSFNNRDGYYRFETPYNSWVRTKELIGINSTKFMMVLTDPKIIENIAKYGHFTNVNTEEYDAQLRKNMAFLLPLTGTPILLNNNDHTVVPQRKALKDTLSETEWINKVLYDSVTEWLTRIDSKTIDFTRSFKRIMFKIVCQSIIGIDKLPEGEDLDNLISLVDKLDEYINLDPESIECLDVAKKMEGFSKWLIENNKESILKRKNMVTDLIKRNEIEKINVGLILAATSNITRLIVTSLTFIAYHPKWQERLKDAHQKEDKKFLDRFYKECCRLFISTAFTSRYVSKDVVMTSESGNDVLIPAGTTVFIPHRRLHFHHYSDPETFNPDRPEFLPKEGIEPIKINTPKLSPFGLGQRACPASRTFTRPTFDTIIGLFMDHCILSKPEDSCVKFEIPSSRDPYAKLTQEYFVTVNKIAPINSIQDDKGKDRDEVQGAITKMYQLRIDNSRITLSNNGTGNTIAFEKGESDRKILGYN